MVAEYQLRPPPKLNPAAVLAIAATVASFVLSCSGRGLTGLIAALVGMAAGVVGFVWGAAPGFRGAVLSLIAIFLSTLALVPAIAALAGKLSRHF